MKVYVVTDGDYSDYGILATFSTLEKAEVHKRLTCASNDIEEYELDGMQDAVSVPVYSCRVFLESGEIVPDNGPHEMIVPNPRWHEVSGSGYITYAQSTVSMDHAIKLCVEARQKWLRENQK